MEALPRWPFIAHSCANLYWQTLPITLFHNLQHSLKKYWGHIISHFGVTCKKERLPFVTTTITWRRKLKKTELTSKKEDEEKSFLQFSALYVFCNIVCDAKKWFLLEKNFSCYYQNFSWKRTVPLRFLLKKNCAAKISPEKELFLPLSESLLKKNHYQVRLADGSRVVVKLNTFHTVTHWKLFSNFDPTRIMFAWFAEWKEVIFLYHNKKSETQHFPHKTPLKIMLSFWSKQNDVCMICEMKGSDVCITIRVGEMQQFFFWYFDPAYLKNGKRLDLWMICVNVIVNM